MPELSGPSQIIVKGVTAALDAAGAIADPIDRSLSLKQAILVLEHESSRLRRGRGDALREGVGSRSVASVAAELGVSRQRLHQLMSGA